MAENTVVTGQAQKCPKCKEDILAGAKKCKHCGADLRNWFARHKILTTILIIIGLPIFLSFFSAITSELNSAREEVSKTDSERSAEAEEKKAEELRKKEVTDRIAQVQVVSYSIKENSIGTQELHITIKNNSKKTLDAVDVQVNFYNNYDEPVSEWGVQDEDPFEGTIQKKLIPGQSSAYEYNLAVYDNATKAKNLIITRIHFTDGETIELE